MQGLGVIAMQHQHHHDEPLAVKNTCKTNLVEEWLGINKLCHLLRMLRLPNEVALKVACPVYKAIALASKSFKMGELKDAIGYQDHYSLEAIHCSGTQRCNLL